MLKIDFFRWAGSFKWTRQYIWFGWMYIEYDCMGWMRADYKSHRYYPVIHVYKDFPNWWMWLTEKVGWDDGV